MKGTNANANVKQTATTTRLVSYVEREHGPANKAKTVAQKAIHLPANSYPKDYGGSPRTARDITR
jgi:hypothetical protein